jgi:hypothetical protein
LSSNLLNFLPNFAAFFLLKMKTIHENLDTSFVNLSALVRYLSKREFTGNVRVELKDYEADIVFTKGNQPTARERDRISGRVAEGEEALQRLLIRAREPGGTVHVYQAAAENNPINEKAASNGKAVFGIKENKKEIVVAHFQHTERSTEKPFSIQTAPSLQNRVNGNEKTEIFQPSSNGIITEAKPNLKIEGFPFELSNNVEAKAKQNQLSNNDWETLLNLTAELLRTVDDSLARANLNFPAAFEKACAEVSKDYPFLNPDSGIFVYKNREIEIRKLVNPKLFVAGINETLRRILAKLGANPKFAESRRATVQNILALIHKRKPLYDRFSVTPPLEIFLGA